MEQVEVEYSELGKSAVPLLCDIVCHTSSVIPMYEVHISWC